MTDFVHLHLHTEYSLLDGACRIKQLMARLRALGQTHVAITDHGVMYGVIDFYKAAKEAGIHPIIGCEVYVAPRTRFDREHERDYEPAHLVLLCENNKGYQNLMYLVSHAFTEGFYGKPRVDLGLLAEHAEGLIALSACIAGGVARRILASNYEGAREHALALSNIFGSGNFFLELQDHGLPEQREVNRALRRMAQETGLPLVATNDAHYLAREDAVMQDVLMCIQMNKTVDDENRVRFSSQEFYVKSGDEMAQLFPNDREALENTVKIAQRCQVDFEFGKYHLPEYKKEPGEESLTHFEILRKKCYEGLSMRYCAQAEQYHERLDYELSIIDRMGFCDYFLIVQDFILYAKNSGIAVGGGRGSSANSIVSYSLRITDIDPMRFELFFDRFLNPERVSMPDIDMDFCYVRRQEIIEYVRDKYGADHVAQIVTFGTMAARAAVRDVGRALNIPYADVDVIAKLVPFELHMTLDRALEVSSQLRARYESEETVRRLIDMARSIEGMPRHASTHAAGVVITDRPVYEYVPLATSDETVVTQFGMVTIEELGLLKMDFLGLRNVTVIDDAQKMIRRHTPHFDIHKVADDDLVTYKMLAEGKTVGVFQVESAGMTNLIMQMQPASIEDMTAAVALYRPGPMDSIPRFIEGRRNPARISYKDPMVEEILAPTYGCMVYQEQVMMICRKLAGYSLGRADIVRRAMSKKKYDVLERERESFIGGALERGVSEAAAQSIFEEMQEFAKYAFPKGHAVAYAIIAYQTAYLKANYPREYMAALLTSVLDSSDKVAEYINECRAMGIRVLPPDINTSSDGFTVDGENIRFGMVAVKNVGRGFIRRLVEEREKNGQYLTFQSFCERLTGGDLNRRTLESLIKAGAFDSLGLYRAQLLTVAERVLSMTAAQGRSTIEGQVDLFAMVADEDAPPAETALPAMPELSLRELLAFEKESTGMYLSGHPMEEYRQIVASIGSASLADILASFSGEEAKQRYEDGQIVTVAGMIGTVRQKTTKSNSVMAYITLEDLTSSLEVIVFSRTLTQATQLVREGTAILLRGRISVREDEAPKLVCVEIVPLTSQGEALFKMAGGPNTSAASARYAPPPRAAQNAAEISSQGQASRAEEGKKLYLRVDNGNQALLARTMALLRVFTGSIPVILYDSSTKTARRAPREAWVMPHALLMEELCALLGPENVRMQ